VPTCSGMGFCTSTPGQRPPWTRYTESAYVISSWLPGTVTTGTPAASRRCRSLMTDSTSPDGGVCVSKRSPAMTTMSAARSCSTKSTARRSKPSRSRCRSSASGPRKCGFQPKCKSAKCSIRSVSDTACASDEANIRLSCFRRGAPRSLRRASKTGPAAPGGRAGPSRKLRHKKDHGRLTAAQRSARPWPRGQCAEPSVFQHVQLAHRRQRVDDGLGPVGQVAVPVHLDAETGRQLAGQMLHVAFGRRRRRVHETQLHQPFKDFLRRIAQQLRPAGNLHLHTHTPPQYCSKLRKDAKDAAAGPRGRRGRARKDPRGPCATTWSETWMVWAVPTALHRRLLGRFFFLVDELLERVDDQFLGPHHGVMEPGVAEAVDEHCLPVQVDLVQDLLQHLTGRHFRLVPVLVHDPDRDGRHALQRFG